MDASGQLIRADKVTRTFDAGQVRPLVGASVAVAPGEFLAVIGESGSGKTTLLNLLGLLDKPETGEITIGGVSTTGLGERELTAIRARQLGFVFQDALVDPRRTAAQNVELALCFARVPRAERPARVERALVDSGVVDRSHVLAGDVSGGERQRIAVARATAHRPQVLLCDEPTGNLDEANTRRVFDLLDRYRTDDRAVVMVTHDLTLARLATRTVMVSRGSINQWKW